MININKFLSQIFNQEHLIEYRPTVDKINSLRSELSQLKDEELKKKSQYLQEQVDKGISLEVILPEAFALIREVSKRVIGLEHFDVQLMGGIALHKGKIAEMKTGEGKTLVATLPAYLNSLLRKGVHIVTVNDYLAKRDSEWVGQIYRFLGLKVGLIQNFMTKDERKKNYLADITYVTNSELGFDYLRDNLVKSVDEIVQREFYYAIIDEVDSILIDEARTPLIISGQSNIIDEKYKISCEIVKELQKGHHYEIDYKYRNIILKDKGIVKCEKLLNINDLYDIKDPWAPYILNALRAKELFQKNVHYIINNNQIIIVDEFTGRIMPGRRWADGLHQSIEAKENLEIQKETQTLASITYQNLFLLYPKLSGMTGTAKTEEAEFNKIYNLEVVVIPTNKPMIRKDLSDVIYKTEYYKWNAVLSECKENYSKGRPVLVGTTSVEKSELISNLLKTSEIPHQVLNAKPENAEREAEIIAQAGRKYSITIATNMAGRGTDIILGGNIDYLAKSNLQFIYKSLIQKNNNDINCNCIYDALIKTFDINLSYQTQKVLKNFIINLKQYLNNININEIDFEEKLILASKNFNQSDYLCLEIKKAYQSLISEYKIKFVKEHDEIIRLGGLYIIGTERHESRRIDNQLRGRAGRQGDPGSSRFFLSLEDSLLKTFGSDRLISLMNTLKLEDSIPIESSFINQSLESAQKKVESFYFNSRKQLFEYDKVLNTQRQIIYSERKKILLSDDNLLKKIALEFILSSIDDCLASHLANDYNKKLNYQNKDNIVMLFEDLLSLSNKFSNHLIRNIEVNGVRYFFHEQSLVNYELKSSLINKLEMGLMSDIERYFLLEQIDSEWKEHLKQIANLQETIGWRSYGQKDPLIEYKKESFNLFVKLIIQIRHNFTVSIFRFIPLLKDYEAIKHI
ncbi:[pt] preprotein translocase subunit A [Galdieria sulphuraria]|uniref:Protein translocase subunit SecA n=1 Tax=Galdieria sulphuraria TaxID=130081 RepID=M2XEQ1_GALSU|nr:preprotein translocase subunit SecA [Galdieria sulphuraria]XP_005704977.1 [pt] preprotein translocase subunit A [Galdieria sulphuraria]AIG92620.1 preprotein translocase subunit SecA [Galdieria sulphuraria]EME28457.1 [pt] preprotein translocase subunit A [Galdieria sulphuraria]|eukprot:XP_005704977.1 [pt] preprotein translocase subunit A [Galdieria sulphuraria]